MLYVASAAAIVRRPFGLAAGVAGKTNEQKK